MRVQSTRNVDYALSNCVIEKFVTSQVSLQPSNVEAVGIAEAFESCKLDAHANLISRVFSWRTVHAFWGVLCAERVGVSHYECRHACFNALT